MIIRRPSSAGFLVLSVLLVRLPALQAQQRAAAPGVHHSTAPALAPSDAARLQSALADYDAGNLPRAKPVLVDLAARYPHNLEAHAAAGMIFAEQGDIPSAERYLKAAHAIAPGNADIALNLAVAELKNNHAIEALPLLLAAAAQRPGDPAVCTALAQAQMQTGQPAAAAVSFSKADASLRMQGQGSDADLRHDWAVALLAAGRADEATAVLQATPGADSAAATQQLLAESEEKSGHYEAAVQHFRRAAELDASEPNLYSYGNELMQHWTFPAAIDIFRFASQRYPESERVQMALGIAYFGNGSYDKAVPVFQALLAKQPDSAAAADLLGRSCSALAGAQQAGCATLLPFAQAHPGNAPASLYAAIAMLHQPADKQDATAAEALLRNALHVNPRLAEAWYELGALQQSQDQWQQSADSLQHALAVRPGYPEAHYRLARAYSHLGKRDEAQQQIALQQKYAADAKDAENKRMQEVMTFLTTSN